jgi:hypothetical protein
MSCKRRGRKDRGLLQRVILGFVLRDRGKRGKLQEINRCRGRNSNRLLPEYKSEKRLSHDIQSSISPCSSLL